MKLTPPDFEFIRTLIHTEAGIVLEPGKEYLVESRLAVVARQAGLKKMSVLIAQCRANRNDPLRHRIVEAMTTNETSFFRDVNPFITLRKTILPPLIASRSNTHTLNIWCGASSTGQEPYTIAMVLRDEIPHIDMWKLTFIASDISSEMIARSKSGVYNQIEINRGLSPALLAKYFHKQGADYQANDCLRKMIDFREMNLTQAWPNMPGFDLIFMRNVLIYFDLNTKKDILRRARKLLKPDGTLFLGGAETTMGLDDEFERGPGEISGTYRIKTAAMPKARAA